MNKVLLIHGYNGIPTMFEYFKEELIKLNYEVIMPILPSDVNVRYDIWKESFNNCNFDLSGKLIVICHSIGNSFIIKYLNEYNLNIGLYISLAGFSEFFLTPGREDLDNAVRSLVPSLEECKYFKDKVDIKYCLYSDNDHVVPLEVLKSHISNVGGIDYLIPNIGHMGKKSNLESLPEVLAIIHKHNS